jgi:proline iminopeptidase
MHQGYTQTRHGWMAYFVSEGAGPPAVFVNGGPGMPCSPDVADALRLPLPIVFYDQTGCGLSDPDEDGTLDHHVEDLEDLADGLGLDAFPLIGVSWGAAVALEYAHRNPTRVSKLVLGSPFISASDWNADQRKNVEEMDEPYRGIMLALIDDEVMDAGFDEAHARYIMAHSTLDLDEAAECLRGMDNPAYRRMWGVSEAKCTGSLRDTEISSRLEDVEADTLVYCGDRDELRPETAARYAGMVKNGHLFVAPGSGHGVNHDCPEVLGKVLEAFLADDRGISKR